MSEMPFETLKARAKHALDTRIARCDPFFPRLGFDSEAACLALIPYAVLCDDDRAALRELARTTCEGSDLAQRARTHAEAMRTGWSQWLLHVRQTGHRRIDAWDVRCVAGLIVHFPECVSQRLRPADIACHVDGNTDAWVVAFDPSTRRPARPAWQAPAPTGSAKASP